MTLKPHIFAFLLCTTPAWLTMTAQTESITFNDTIHHRVEKFLLPTGMTFSMDSLKNTWQYQHYLYADTTHQENDYNPDYLPDFYMQRIDRMPTLIPMSYNTIVQRFIDVYCQKERERLSYLLGVSNLYVPVIEKALDAFQLPLELKYFPALLSAYYPKTTALNGQSGIWQLDINTANKYKLVVNSLIDERRDTYKSTWAAAQYLRDLHTKYNDWLLTLVAFNTGSETVDKAISRADNNKDYWKILPYLPAESRGIVPAFIATCYVMNFYCDHNITPMKTHYPESYDTVMVSRPINLKQIADYCQIPLTELQALNAQYKTNYIPGNALPCTLCMTQEKIDYFLDHENEIYAHRAKEWLSKKDLQLIDKYTPISISTSPITETVKTPTTTTVNKTTSRTSKRSSRKTRNSKTRSTATYTNARNGDSLYKIAKRHNTTVNKLRQINKLRGNSITVGQKIRVR